SFSPELVDYLRACYKRWGESVFRETRLLCLLQSMSHQ
ncbi:hypothetical protein CFC21_103854, partial [Triticum aestivum]